MVAWCGKANMNRDWVENEEVFHSLKHARTKIWFSATMRLKRLSYWFQLLFLSYCSFNHVFSQRWDLLSQGNNIQCRQKDGAVNMTVICMQHYLGIRTPCLTLVVQIMHRLCLYINSLAQKMSCSVNFTVFWKCWMWHLMSPCKL